SCTDYGRKARCSSLFLQREWTLKRRTGNNVFNPKEDTNHQSKILALLLHNSLVPVEKDDPLGLELANKLAQLEELQALREDLELEREITANLAEGKSITRKRGEPCFWKYCV
uniref:Urotensin-2B n=1 Tax=Sander lucioperca TaxID=283035 RepID=A0A8D0CNY4_SANLU